jgi:hypothetical protein
MITAERFIAGIAIDSIIASLGYIALTLIRLIAARSFILFTNRPAGTAFGS